MTLAAREQALLDLVEADRTLRCDKIMSEARASAAATLAAARAEALGRIRSTFASERERRAARVAAAGAKLQTHRRLHDQRRAAALVTEGWLRLPVALRARWQQRQSQRAWVECVIAAARVALPRGTWRIVHAPRWPDEERAALCRSLAAELGASPQLVADDTIQAGLRVAAGRIVIDGTLDGLLADRSEIGAGLLRHLEQAR
jgi:hypothetical protein